MPFTTKEPLKDRGSYMPAKKISEKYEDFLGEGHYFIPGAKELLEDLSKKYHLYLASNGAVKVQMSRIKSAGIEKYLEKKMDTLY